MILAVVKLVPQLGSYPGRNFTESKVTPVFSSSIPLISLKTLYSTMKNSECLSVGVLLATLCLACSSGVQHTTSEKDQRPNILLIMTDDQGYGDVGFHGNPHIRTPNLDKLAAESIRFTNFHSGTTCSPTRAGLMTGINCNRTGTWHTILGRSLLSNRFPTMATYLREAGYTTGIFGKWHLGDNYPFRPQDRGFEEVFIHGGGGVGQTPDYWNNDYFDDTYYNNNSHQSYEGYCTDIWFDGAMEFIERKAAGDQPFFCYLVTNAPHGPYHVAEKYIDLYQDNPEIPNPNFYGMITNIDENLGRLEDKLTTLGIRENTLLIFMTDNGTAAGASLDQQGHVTHGFNANMRGKKGSEYEGGHRVPCFMRFPSALDLPQRDQTELVTHTDLVPTLLDFVSATPDRLPDFDGISILPLITNGHQDGLEDRIVVVDKQRQEFAEKWKNASVMKNNWRLINNKELYNLASDPGQQDNIFDDHPDIAKELAEGYENWWRKVEPDLAFDNNIIVGTPYESPTLLTCHDWHSDSETHPPWHQSHVRSGKENNGYWLLEVAQPGQYQIRLYRWPPYLNKGFADTVPPGDVVSGGTRFKEGVALPTARAKIKIQEREWTANKMQDNYFEFSVELEEGPTPFQTWCYDASGNSTRGAYYVEIEQADR